ncbi:aggregation-promoting factor C-terminal-like domain-containing protein [Microbacterium suaedae]|uniref:aggregation-promoting factor C-terminal-like domain-containing protein n=1 Tax=Microbacterium suaedae TaxID=2067813 RepID=UPI001E55B370|nr:phospholipase [Microbacterium suaedae]
MTTDETPLLTPFPRANHLRLLRQDRERRRRRFGFGAALAVGLLAVGTGTSAYAMDTMIPREKAGTIQTATGETAAEAQETLVAAKNLLERAEDKVDATELTASVEYLEDYEGMPASIADDATAEANEAIEDLTVEVTEYEEEQAAKAEQERKEQEEAAAAAAAEEQAAAEALAAANTVEGAKATAQQLALSTYGWGGDQFSCLDLLWTKESGWNYQASNPSSGAYGIPQSLPGSKMATVASDWASNATTQITWGLQYISAAYGTPCAAWGHSQAVNWY